MTAADLVFRDFEPADAASVTKLWQECGLTRPWNDPVKDIERKLTDRNGAFWVVCRGNAVIASVMIGYDGHRGTINYLAIAPQDCDLCDLESSELLLISVDHSAESSGP